MADDARLQDAEDASPSLELCRLEKDNCHRVFRCKLLGHGVSEVSLTEETRNSLRTITTQRFFETFEAHLWLRSQVATLKSKGWEDVIGSKTRS